MENDSIRLTGSKRETTRKLSLHWNTSKAALEQGNSKVPKTQRSGVEEQGLTVKAGFVRRHCSKLC